MTESFWGQLCKQYSVHSLCYHYCWCGTGSTLNLPDSAKGLCTALGVEALPMQHWHSVAHLQSDPHFPSDFWQLSEGKSNFCMYYELLEDPCLWMRLGNSKQVYWQFTFIDQVLGKTYTWHILWCYMSVPHRPSFQRAPNLNTLEKVLVCLLIYNSISGSFLFTCVFITNKNHCDLDRKWCLSIIAWREVLKAVLLDIQVFWNVTL